MKKIIISTDSPMDLPASLREKYDIAVLPLHVLLGESSYEDGVNITSDDIFNYYEKNKVLPKTSAISVAEYEKFFKKSVEDGCEVVHISMSLGLSSTYQNAVIAASSYEGVYVLDSFSLTGGMGIMCIHAVKLREEGKSAKEIYEDLTEYKDKLRVSFILDKLEFMQKGGRCSATAAFGANLLGIRPSIVMKDGKLGVGKKYRGKFDSCLLQYTEDVLAEAGNADKSLALIIHTDGFTASDLEPMRQKALEFGFKEVLPGDAGCVITSHCGKGTVGLLYADK